MSDGRRAGDRAGFIERYRRGRERSRALFNLLEPDAYYSQPISLRHPIVFYEGHLPAFSFNTLIKRGLGQPGIDDRLERLFARGIDPPEDGSPAPTGRDAWPSRSTVQKFAEEADRRILEALQREDIDRPGHPLLDSSEAVFAILEHESMHQETLLYMWHRLAFDQKHAPSGYVPPAADPIPRPESIGVPPGRATLGVDRGAIPFGWDNEFGACAADVPAFSIDRYNVTNASFLEFVEAGGYENPKWWSAEDWAWVQAERIRHPLFWEQHDRAWFWRGMFGLIPLPASWPVYVTGAEARAFAAWWGARLPTEAEFQRAAYGSPDGRELSHPWGDEAPTAQHGVFDFSSWEPHSVGSHPAGRSAWGVDDLVGNGWEWTSSIFEPFPGFRPMASYPEYSADFFDRQHFVIKGASPATARELLRPTFRNWFRGRYPYVYASFRLVRDST